MVAQALDLVLGFLPHVLEELRCRGVQRAGKHEVVPDQDPLFVAQVVEVVALVLAAAPDAEHVHVRRDRARQQVVVARTGLPRRQRVARDPVRALAEHLDAVDLEVHRQPDLVLLGDHLKRAQADALAHVVPRHAHGQIVQVLLAVPGRPPQARVLERKRRRERVQPGLQFRGARDRDRAAGDLERGAATRGRRHFAGDLQFAAALAVLLCRGDVLDAARRGRAQVQVTADTPDHQADTPVPAGVTLNLADQIAVRRLHDVLAERDRIRQRLCCRDRRDLRGAHDDRDLVPAATQQRLDFEPVAPEHVVGPPGVLAVDEDLGDGVQAVAIQDDRRVPEQGPVDIKRAG